MNLNEQMKAYGLKRWHTVEMSRQQSVAEHQWGVTMIAREIYFRLVDEPAPSGKNALMIRALVHDMDEINGGDVPANHKSEKDISDDFFSAVVDVADKMEAYWYATWYAAGPTRNAVVADTEQRMKRKIEQFESKFGIKDDSIKEVYVELMTECYDEREDTKKVPWGGAA